MLRLIQGCVLLSLFSFQAEGIQLLFFFFGGEDSLHEAFDLIGSFRSAE